MPVAARDVVRLLVAMPLFGATLLFLSNLVWCDMVMITVAGGLAHMRIDTWILPVHAIGAACSAGLLTRLFVGRDDSGRFGWRPEVPLLDALLLVAGGAVAAWSSLHNHVFFYELAERLDCALGLPTC